MRNLMRNWLSIALGVALVVGVAGPSRAAPLNWEGTLTTSVGELPTLDITGGGVATLNGSSGPIPAHLDTLRVEASRGGISGTDTVVITDPEVAGNGLAAIILEGALRTGTLSPISGAVASTGGLGLTQSTLPVGGLAKLCLLSTVCTDFIPLILTQPTIMGGVEGLGVGGLIAGGAYVIRISLEGAPWTVKTATAIDQTDDNTGAAAFHNVTRMGFAHGPVSGTTSTAQPSGVLQLVTPSQVRTNLAGGSQAKVAVFTELLIHFIPEPSLVLLLGSGVAGLALIGRSRMRK